MKITLLLTALLLLGSTVGILYSAPVTGVIEVVQNDATDTDTAVSLSFGAGTSFNVSLLPASSNDRGDYGIDFAPFHDFPDGVLITSIANNGRDNSAGGDPAGTAYATSAYGISGGSTFTNYDIKVTQAGTSGLGPDYNADVSFGWFQTDEWLAAVAQVSVNNGAITSIDGTAGLSFADPATGGSEEFQRTGLGTYAVDLRNVESLGGSSAEGILLVNAATVEDNYALSRPNADGTFTIFGHDNGFNGAAYENDSIAFVYIPTSRVGSDALVAMGRIQSDGTSDLEAGSFTLTKETEVSGTWRLSIPGHSVGSGTLLVSSEGGDSNNLDNYASSEWDEATGSWIIESRDISSLALEDGSTSDELMFSFAFFAGNQVSTLEDQSDASGSGLSLRQALRNAEPGAVITFAPELSGGTFTLLRGSELEIDRALSIDAGQLSSPITFDAIDSSRIFDIEAADPADEPISVNLTHLHLTNGNAYSSSGGAIYNRSTSLTLNEVAITNCTADSGGAIRNIGIDRRSPAALTLNNVFIHGNSATTGAGITLSTGGSGTAPAIFNHTTITDNWASNRGGGIDIYNNAELTLMNTVVAENGALSAANGPDIHNLNAPQISESGTNFVGIASGSGLTTSANLLTGDPKLAPLNFYSDRFKTRQPYPDSPLLNAATGSNLSTDIVGATRVGAPDIGAKEFTGGIYTVTTTDDQDDTPVGDETSLREAIRMATDDNIPGSIIDFDPTIFGTTTSTILLTAGEIVINEPNGLTIYAGNLPTKVTLNTDHKSRMLYATTPPAVATPGSLTLENIRFTKGKIGGTYVSGGAIQNQNNQLVIKNCSFENNIAFAGGAIANLGVTGDQHIIDGYRVYESGFAELSIINSSFYENQARLRGGEPFYCSGGAIYNYAEGESTAILNVINTTFAKNISEGSGGAIFNSGWDSVGENQVTDVNLTHSTFIGNTAVGYSFEGDTIANYGWYDTVDNKYRGIVRLNNCIIGENGKGSNPAVGNDEGLIIRSNNIESISLNFAKPGIYGSDTRTCPPLLNASAINSGSGYSLAYDQRGFPRYGGADIGAAESSDFFVVSTVDDENDSPAGSSVSLREAINLATTSGKPGTLITFDGAQFTPSSHTINLSHGELVIPSPNALILYAGYLEHGITIDPNGNSRAFYIGSDAVPALQTSASLHSFNIKNGHPAESDRSGHGGGIYNNNNSLYLTNCLIADNSGEIGAGLYNRGKNLGSYTESIIENSTFMRNTGRLGGAIYSSAAVSGSTLLISRNSSFHQNRASEDAGGLYNVAASGGKSRLQLEQCTVSQNHAGNDGGGLRLFGSRSITEIYNSVITENSANGIGPDIDTNSQTLTNYSVNLIGDLSETGLTAGSNLLTGEANLSELGLYGSRFPTRIPLFESPLIGAAGTNRTSLDQRGFPSKDNADLGATESSKFIMVNTLEDEDDGNFGGIRSLRDAISEADTDGSKGIVIDFDPTVFTAKSHTIQLTNGALSVSDPRGLTIYAGSLEKAVRLDAQNNSRIITFSNPSLPEEAPFASMHFLEFTNGSETSGGAILNQNTRLYVSNSSFYGNSATTGGAVSNDGDGKASYFTAQNSTFTQNAADEGGAIHNTSIASGNATLELNSVTIYRNLASGDGGGIDNQRTSNGRAPLLLRNSIVASNIAGGSGNDISNPSAITYAFGRNLLSDLTDSDLATGPDILVADPNLAEFGDYGGSTLTATPLLNSPAIDAAGNGTATTDQRTFERFGTPDLGAVEATTFHLVDTRQDQNDVPAGAETSLREALAQAALDQTPGSLIVFDPTVFTSANHTIPLTFGELQILSPKALTIYAADLDAGVTIDAQNASRVFYTGSETEPSTHQSVRLHSLELINGLASGFFPDNLGGAILNQNNTLTIIASTLIDNQASYGGAIFNNGNSLTAFNGLDGQALLFLRNSSIMNNTATYGGGAIYNNGSSSGFAFIFMDSVSITDNTVSFGAGGGLFNIDSGGTTILTLADSIIAENTALVGPDVYDTYGILAPSGVNLIGDLSESNLSESSTLLVGDPELAPLAYYGGRTRTRPPLPDSPAIDPVEGTVFITGSDQRGLPRTSGSSVDLGAVEIQGATDELVITFNLDPDEDGYSNGLELAIGSDPDVFDPSHPSHLAIRILPNGNPDLGFGYARADIGLKLTRSTDLVNFDTVIGHGGIDFLADVNVPLLMLEDSSPPEGKAFYRLEAIAPIVVP